MFRVFCEIHSRQLSIEVSLDFQYLDQHYNQEGHSQIHIYHLESIMRICNLPVNQILALKLYDMCAMRIQIDQRLG